MTNKTDFGFDNRFYWIFVQLVTTVHRSLSDTLSSSFRLDTPRELFWLPTELSTQVKVMCMLRPTVSRPVYLGVKHQIFVSNSCGFVHVEHLLWREDGSVFYNVQYIVTDFLKALLGDGPVNTFQRTRHSTVRWKCFLRVCARTVAMQRARSLHAHGDVT
jgi:hypothetical protein